MLHVIDGWFVTANITPSNFSGGGLRYILDNVVLMVINRFAVPAFIMISGCLLLNPKKNVTLDKIKTYLKRMILVLLIFGGVFCLIGAFITVGSENILKVFPLAISNLIQGNAWAHMWYIYALIGLYMITPLLRKFTESASKKEAKFLLISLFILLFMWLLSYLHRYF